MQRNTTVRRKRTLRFAALIVSGSGLIAACSGGGGGAAPPPNNPPNQPPPAGGNVTVSGRITFDRFVFAAPPALGLNTQAPVQSPARQVVVELLSGNTSTVLASAETDLDGRYSFTVPVNTSVRVQARAQMLRTGTAPTWDFRVLNNRNGDAQYAVVSPAPFSSGTANVEHNLHAPTGWGGTSYTADRVAAPFAILDTVFRAKELILTANPAAALPPLNLFWSSTNKPAGPFCPDQGNIVTSSYIAFPSAPNNLDECGVPQLDGIYILGDFTQGDTDEFDQHVVAHEFGHYYDHRLSRSDSIGGSHQGNDRLDMRVSFGEGWGNAYAGMTLGDPLYRDSFEGVSNEFGFDLENDFPTQQGWFSEFSVGEFLWDVFDGANEPGDTVRLGFPPIHAVMTGPQVNTDALTSIFPFANALRAQNTTEAAAINTLLNGESISGTDDFGSGENNDGGDASVLPIYEDIALNTPVPDVCSTSAAGSDSQNKLGNNRFLRFVNDTPRLVIITAAGAATNPGSEGATDPDIRVHRRGEIVAFGDSAVPGSETIPQVQLPAGTYIIEVWDFDLQGINAPPRCMTVSIQG